MGLRTCNLGTCVCEHGYLGVACEHVANLVTCMGTLGQLCLSVSLPEATTHIEAQLSMQVEKDSSSVGWFGLTLGAPDGMSGGDCWVVQVEQALEGGTEGEGPVLRLEDRYSPDLSTPYLDQQQDLILLSSTINDTHFMALFRRQLDIHSGGKDDLDLRPYLLKGLTLPIGWAHGPAKFKKHVGLESRGRAILNFVSGETIDLAESQKWSYSYIYSPFGLTLAVLSVALAGLVSACPSKGVSRSLHGRVLPSRWLQNYSSGEALMILVFGLINLAFFVHSRRSLRGSYEDVSLSWAHLSIINLILLLLLPTRNSLCAALLCISHERTIKYHRWAAYAFILGGSVHGLMQAVHKGPDIFFKSEELPFGKGAVYGSLALALTLLMLLFSTERVRRLQWELFRSVHFLAFLMLYFLYLHFKPLLSYLVLPLALYALDRGLRFYKGRYKNTSKLIRANPLGSTKLLQDGGDPVTVLKLSMPYFRFEPGQYCYLNIPVLSRTQWHPISISSKPC